MFGLDRFVWTQWIVVWTVYNGSFCLHWFTMDRFVCTVYNGSMFELFTMDRWGLVYNGSILDCLQWIDLFGLFTMDRLFALFTMDRFVWKRQWIDVCNCLQWIDLFALFTMEFTMDRFPCMSFVCTTMHPRESNGQLVQTHSSLSHDHKRLDHRYSQRHSMSTILCSPMIQHKPRSSLNHPQPYVMVLSVLDLLYHYQKYTFSFLYVAVVVSRLTP